MVKSEQANEPNPGRREEEEDCDIDNVPYRSHRGSDKFIVVMGVVCYVY